MVVDADVIIRFLTEDDKVKAEKFKKFLMSGETIVITDVTFAEIFWTLKSFYKLEKDKVILMLESLLNTSSIICQKDLLLETLSILKKGSLSLIDSYICAFSLTENDGKILSYDKGFDKLKLIKRIEL